MAKRPQPGLPNVTPQVVARPVDTAEIAGAAGMPAAPNSIARPPRGPDIPAPVNDQGARDMANLARSFGGLSQSIRGLAFAKEEYNEMLEIEGRQLAAYIDWSNKESLTFTKALSDGQIEALDHPRFASSMAEAAARQRVALLKKTYDEERVKILAGDSASDIDAYESVLNGLQSDAATAYRGPRSDVYRAELAAAFAFEKEFLLSKERTSISGMAIETAQRDLSNGVTNAVLTSQDLHRNTIVESNRVTIPFKNEQQEDLYQTVNIIGETDEQYYQRQVSTAVATIENLLDQGRGKLLSSTSMNRIVGSQLIELAKSNRQLSKFAEDVLNSVETGPPDSRSPLNSGEIKSRYLLEKDRIDSLQIQQVKEMRASDFRADTKNITESIEDLLIQQLAVSNSSTDFALGNLIRNTFEDGEMNYGPYVLEVDSENIIVNPPDGSNLAPRRISRQSIINEVERRIIDDAVSQDNSQDPIEIKLARASAETGMPSRELNDLFAAAAQRFNQYKQQTDSEFFKEQVPSFMPIYRAYQISKAAGAVSMDASIEQIYENFDLMFQDDYLRSVVGTTPDVALRAMAQMNGAKITIPKTVTSVIDDVIVDEDVNTMEGASYVRDVVMLHAKVHFSEGAASPFDAEAATKGAIRSYRNRFRAFHPGIGPSIKKIDTNRYNFDRPIFERFGYTGSNKAVFSRAAENFDKRGPRWYYEEERTYREEEFTSVQFVPVSPNMEYFQLIVTSETLGGTPRVILNRKEGESRELNSYWTREEVFNLSRIVTDEKELITIREMAEKQRQQDEMNINERLFERNNQDLFRQMYPRSEDRIINPLEPQP